MWFRLELGHRLSGDVPKAPAPDPGLVAKRPPREEPRRRTHNDARASLRGQGLRNGKGSRATSATRHGETDEATRPVRPPSAGVGRGAVSHWPGAGAQRRRAGELHPRCVGQASRGYSRGPPRDRNLRGVCVQPPGRQPHRIVNMKILRALARGAPARACLEPRKRRMAYGSNLSKKPPPLRFKALRTETCA